MRLNIRSGLLLFMLCLLAPPSVVAGDAASVGQQREAVLFWSQAQRDAQFSQMYEQFPADRIVHGAHVQALPVGLPLLPRWDDATTLDSYMRAQHIAGVMVLQHGKIRLQRYADNFGPQQRWASFSIAKSFTSTLLGAALRDGYIHSLDDTLATYIPQLRDSAYAAVTVRQLLTMTSGVRWNEDYADPESDVAQMYRSACSDGQPHVLPYLAKLPRERPAGSHWNYNTAETDLLGILVQRATGRSLARYLQETIWQPYGMASDAYWLQDECDGSDTGGSGLSVTLADYARMGQFMLGDARIHGEPVVADDWWHNALHKQQDVGEPGRGYGYQWWTYDDGSFAGIGIFGQLLYVDPQRQLVIVQAGSWPQAGSKALVRSRRAFVAAVKRAADDTAVATPEQPTKP